MMEIVPNWHPVFVHFAIALLLVSVAAFLLAAAVPAEKAWRRQVLDFAHWNLRLGYPFALATAWLGWLAYNSVTHDDAGHGAMTAHRDAALLSLALFTPFFAASWFRHRMGRGLALALSLAIALPGASLLRTGWLGGEAVYRHGLGVLRLPESNHAPAPPAPEMPADAAATDKAGIPPAAPAHRHKHDHKHTH